MSNAEEATARRPPRRRAPWSLRSIVVEVTGKPISDFQEPPATPARATGAAAAAEGKEVDDIDPVEHVYPPLVGPRARAFHGAKREHHAATIERHRTIALGGSDLLGEPPTHPERLYLHYLLLHLDRVSLPSLWYLRRQVNDEIARRERPPSAGPPASGSG